MKRKFPLKIFVYLCYVVLILYGKACNNKIECLEPDIFSIFALVSKFYHINAQQGRNV